MTSLSDASDFCSLLVIRPHLGSSIKSHTWSPASYFLPSMKAGPRSSPGDLMWGQWLHSSLAFRFQHHDTVQEGSLVQNIALPSTFTSNLFGVGRQEGGSWQGGSGCYRATVTNKWKKKKKKLPDLFWLCLLPSYLCWNGECGCLRFWFIPVLSITKNTLGHNAVVERSLT